MAGFPPGGALKSLGIDLDELLGTVDVTIPLRFSHEVEHGAWMTFGQEPVHQFAVARVALCEDVSRVALQQAWPAP